MSTAPTTQLQPRPLKSTTPSLQAEKNKKLTRRQALFIDFYRRGLNPKKAAEAAGYSPSIAENASSIVLQSPTVQNEIARRDAEYFEACGLTDPNDILRKFYSIATANLADYIETRSDGRHEVNLGNVNRDQMYAIQELSYDPLGRPRIRLEPRLKSLEVLLKALLVKKGRETDPNSPLTIADFDSMVEEASQVTNNIQVNIYREATPSSSKVVEASPSSLALGASSTYNPLPEE